MPDRKLFQQTPELVKRYTRRKIVSLSRPLARFILRPYLIARERKKIRSTEKALSSVRALISRCEREGYVHLSRIANAALYITMAELDTAHIKVAALTTHNEWKRKLYIRLFILLMFENKIREIFDKEFYLSLEMLKVPRGLIGDLKDYVRQYNRSHEKFRKKYNSIRVETLAHRNGNATTSYKMIRLLKEEDAIGDIADLYSTLNLVLPLLVKIIRIGGNFESVEKLKSTLRKTADQVE